MDVNSGRETFFWYDDWSKKGRLKEILGNRGSIDLGISDTATVFDVMTSHRRRRHRVQVLNEIEEEIESMRPAWTGNQEHDKALWKHGEDRFKPKFSSSDTWRQLRINHSLCEWNNSVWFKHHTPRYAFILWITMHNRLATGDRMITWNPNIDPSCILCSGHQESRSHLFFDCNYSSTIWDTLVHGLMKGHYTKDWERIVSFTSDTMLGKTEQFLLRYTLGVAVHSIWRERNSRRHGHKPQEHTSLIRQIDKAVRNQLMAIRHGGRDDFPKGLEVWFSTRNSS